MSELSRFDFEPKRIECEDDGIIIRDDFGRKVVQVAALEDLEALEQEILLIGSYPDLASCTRDGFPRKGDACSSSKGRSSWRPTR